MENLIGDYMDFDDLFERVIAIAFMLAMIVSLVIVIALGVAAVAFAYHMVGTYVF